MLKRKKIIKIRKRNPSEISEEGWEKIQKFRPYIRSMVTHIILEPSTRELIRLINDFNQGQFCEDCDMDSYGCECEYCEDCGFNRCLCELNMNSKNSIRKVLWELAKLILDDIELKNFLKYLKHTAKNWEVPDYEFFDNLTISSSFPKERDIMIRLFELD